MVKENKSSNKSVKSKTSKKNGKQSPSMKQMEARVSNLALQNKKISSKLQKGLSVTKEARNNLGDCTTAYLRAIADPWSTKAQGACIPKWPSPPSMKNSAFSRIVITTPSVARNMYFYVMPCMANNSPYMIRTNELHYPSLANVPDSTLTPFKGFSTENPLTYVNLYGAQWLTFEYLSSLPYSISDFQYVNGDDSNVQGRIISSGFSLQNVSKTLDTGGIYYGYVEPTHHNLNNLNPAQLASQRATMVQRGGIKRFELTAYSVHQDEIEYSRDGNVYGLSKGSLLASNDVYTTIVATTLSFTSATVTNLLDQAPVITFVGLTAAGILLLNTKGSCITLSIGANVFYAVCNTCVLQVCTLCKWDCSGYSYSANSAASVTSVIFGGPGRDSRLISSAANPYYAGCPMMAMVIPAAVSSVFELEYIQHNEFLGPKTQGMVRPNTTDMVGFEKVQEVASRVSQNMEPVSTRAKFVAEGGGLFARALGAASDVMSNPRNRRAMLGVARAGYQAYRGGGAGNFDYDLAPSFHS